MILEKLPRVNASHRNDRFCGRQFETDLKSERGMTSYMEELLVKVIVKV